MKRELERGLLDGGFDQFFLYFDAKTKIYANRSSSFELKY